MIPLKVCGGKHSLFRDVIFIVEKRQENLINGLSEAIPTLAQGFANLIALPSNGCN